MMSRFFSRLVVIAMTAVALSGCGRNESYRYKLTLAVNTPDGVKRASSVTEVVFWDVSIPERGTMHKLRGEALYLDLGPGARPLIALLTSQLHPKYGQEQRWSRDAGPHNDLLTRLYDVTISAGITDYVSKIARMRGAHNITSDDLPDLVTFTDIKDPRTVVEVDPHHLQAALGQNVTWNEITLESTDEPVTTGIKAKLPWLPAYFQSNLRLDGSNHGAKRDLANILSWPDFDRSGDLKRDSRTSWADLLFRILRIILRL